MKFKVRAIFLGLVSLCWVPANNECFSQEIFSIKDRSTAYDVDISMDKCDEQERKFNPSLCAGPGRVSIYSKGSTVPFQILKLTNLEIYKERIAYNSKIDKSPRELYGEEYSVIFGDFNFDASEDLAICNGRNGGYGALSYNVYLFNKKSGKLVEHVSFSRLTEGALGLFFLESKKRQLIAYSKSGCCYHETDVYKVVHNKPVLVEKTTETASPNDAAGYVVVIRTR